MKKRAITLGFPGGSLSAVAKQGHDWLGWLGARVNAKLDSSAWSAEVGYQHVTYRNLSRFYRQSGSLHLFYRLGKAMSFSPGYALLEVARDSGGDSSVTGSWKPSVAVGGGMLR